MASRCCGILSQWRLMSPRQGRWRRFLPEPTIESCGSDRGTSGSSTNRTPKSSVQPGHGAFAEELKFPYGDEETPKASIGVKPNARGQGLGEKLMRALIGEAVRRGLGLCLS